jgi:polyisoprenyl-phosphate glycosyltransferase
MDVSLVLAVYNEEECLEQELKTVKEAMAKSGFSYEIIVIDDGSKDKSREILKNTDGIKLILHEKNQGAGATRTEGIKMATGDIIVWTDMDLTYPNEAIPKLIQTLKTGNFRQVIGRRILKKDIPVLRESVKFVLRAFASLYSRAWILDLNSGMRAFYREDALKILHYVPKGFSCCTTLTMTFLYSGWKVGYMDIEYCKRAGKSKFHPIKDTYRCFAQVLRLAKAYKKNEYKGNS